MSSHTLMVQLGVVLAAGVLGGAIARLLRAPVMVGFLIAGLAIGPHTPGLVANKEIVSNVANLGVVLLMFSVGLQFSFRELAEVRKAAVLGGIGQIVATILLGMGLARLLGWDARAGVLLGCAIALSSTAVMVRVLEERGELGSVHGLIMLGVLVVQDLAVVAMAVLLPMLGTGAQSGSGAALTIALGKAIAFVAATPLLASRIVPRVLARVAQLRSRELFVLAVVTMCVGAALAAESAGVELALGAFLAGLVVAGSDYADEVLSQVRPLRDVFASVFFVSVGMLMDPRFVVEHWLAVTAIVAAIVIGKALIGSVAIYLAGRHARTSLKVGFGLAQIGEFSFVLAGIGTARGIIGPDVSGSILAAAALTLLATPFVSQFGDGAYRLLSRFRGLRGALIRMPDYVIHDMAAGCEGSRALVLGYGRIGRSVSDGLHRHGIPHTVVDYDTVAVHMARDRGIAVIYGDAASDVVLRRALADCVEVVVVALPEAPTTEVAVRTIRTMSPDVGIAARVHRAEDYAHIIEAGADAAVFAEDLAGSAMLEAAMGRLGGGSESEPSGQPPDVSS